MSASKNKKSVRLSPHVRPTHYKVHFTPDLNNFVFSGEEEISIDVKAPTRTITLHSAEIEIGSALYTHGTAEQQGTVTYKDKDETATITFAKPIPKGRGKLSLTFAGILNDKMRGFYRSKYEHDGTEYHMATTQFESTDARRAFPCFDEPAHKAIFEVSVTVPSDRTVISNTVETNVAEHDGGFKTVSFAPSPTMSSYLVAMIVGHFEHIQTKTKSGTLVRVYVRPGKKHQAVFALDVAKRSLEFYEKYFGIKYPLPAMDMVAIPDFASGAMENWGAVTYRETALLIDPEHSSTFNKQWVAIVVAHELAHQWFGNLVTMEWWTHLWLNEGFASYISFLTVDALFPQWKMWTQFAYEEQADALSLDGLKNTHAIEIDVNHPAEISEIFDAVSYSKGASVLLMLSEYIGAKNFRDGLRTYLKTHAYDNASTEDLWRAFERASGKDVAAFMRTWTRKPGYPLLSLQDTKKGLVVRQSRFVADGGKADSTRWPIPLTVTTSAGKTDKYVVTGQSATLKKYPLNKWIKVNVGEMTFARTEYSAERLALLESELAKKNTKLSEVDRFGIIRDAFALTESGRLPTADALKLALTYRNDESFIVWSIIAEEILRIRSLIVDEPYLADFERYVRILFKDIAKEVGWEKKKGEKYTHALVRSIVHYVLGTHDDAGTMAVARKLFDREVKKPGSLNPDIRSTVYRLIAESGDVKAYVELRKLYDAAHLEEEKDRLLRALCSSRSEKNLTSILAHAFKPTSRGQDAVKVLSYTLHNPYGRDVAWTFTKSVWAEIERRHGGGGHLFPRFIKPLDVFVTKTKADEIKAFFKRHTAHGTTRTVSQVIEKITSHAAVLRREGKGLAQFLV